MNTHIIIPIADLEAVIKDKQKQLNKKSSWDEQLCLVREIAAYEKILTHYKKVDLSEVIISIVKKAFENQIYSSLGDHCGNAVSYIEGHDDFYNEIEEELNKI